MDTNNMKLLIVTAVEEFHGEIRSLFKKAGIENFSSSEIDGFKNQNALRVSTSWFPGEKGANESSLFFSFTAEEKIDTFFEMIKDFNEKILSPNPVRAIVVPIEKIV